MIAFSTTSSDVALPVALENMVELGVPRHIAALVLPVSMSFNTAGSALFLSLASVFVAQAAGVQLSVTHDDPDDPDPAARPPKASEPCPEARW